MLEIGWWRSKSNTALNDIFPLGEIVGVFLWNDWSKSVQIFLHVHSRNATHMWIMTALYFLISVSISVLQRNHLKYEYDEFMSLLNSLSECYLVSTYQY